MSDLHYAQSTALLANGVFAGLGLCVNLVCVPAIRSAVNPTAVFHTVYKTASKIAISTIVISSAAHFYTYYQTRQIRSLYLGLLSFASFPYTVIFMMPTNNRLFALDATASPEHYAATSPQKKEALALINKWNKAQLFRTTTGVAAFLIGVLYR
ncbi:hypothetical protein CLU79DRAFT_765676 [Phycomyces nitens]|nr:hypothetical protein CLU79DRAFT_765676 [Phycomyces nitens]